MKVVHYPILYYPLEENAHLGFLVGTDYQLVGKDLNAIKNNFQEFLQKDYKKEGEPIDVDIEDFKLKNIDIKVRPRQRHSSTSYAENNDVRISVSVIYGKSEDNQFICYLPLLNDYFHYSESKQLRSLVQYFALDFYNRQSPETIYRHSHYPTPQLDEVRLRVKETFYSDWGGFDFDLPLTTLPKVAEEYPYPKAVRKNLNQFPDAAWELEKIVEDIANHIYDNRVNVLVVGNNGVGKSAALRSAIRSIKSKAKKEEYQISFWRAQAQRITASAKYLGEWQKTFSKLVRELNDNGGILWIEDVIQLLQTGGASAQDSLAAFMINFLQNGELQLLGEVTPIELESMKRMLPNFVECFQLIHIHELSEKQVQSVMDKFADFCKKNIGIRIPKSSVTLSYRLLLRYFPYLSFPGKGINFFQQCVHEAQLNEKATVSNKTLIQNFTNQTGLPELFLRDDILMDKNELRTYFNSKIIGQPEAVKNLTDIVTIFKAGLNNPKKPINTLLFAGPTGVGKTQSAKVLANYFFGKGQKKNPLIRIDMSEFQHASQITNLIGSGKNVGKLVQEVREKPFSVLLLDEVEKADPSIFDALLTMLDEGVLVDAFGRVTNFRNTIVIMTSNLGASNRKSLTFKETESNKTKYMSAISGFFRPEFLNRIDNIVMFNSLKMKDIEKIAHLELDLIKKREGFVKKNIDLIFTAKIIKHLIKKGFDEDYGARPMQRAIEQEIVIPMSNWILENPKVKNVTLEIDYLKKMKVSIR